jgi:SHO1 osmosensor
MLCCIIGVFVVIASDTIQTYHVAIVGYLACGLVLTSSSVNSLIYSSNGAKEATAAGHILLSMVNVRSLLCSPLLPYLRISLPLAFY